jgi:hypothetical protein
MRALRGATMKRTRMILLAVLGLAAAAMAQMPQPSAEVKKLDIFVGSWTLDGDMKASSMGPGGKVTETEKCEWMDGGFFVICHTDFKSAMGDGTGFSVMGYSADDKAYTYREFNSWGEFDDSKGSVDADTWTWTNDEKMEGKIVKGKFSMKFLSPTSYTFSFDMSPDGTKWTTMMDGKASKAK